MLLDSNIIIYAMQPGHRALRRMIAENAPSVSAISYVEVLGYYGLDELEREGLRKFFSVTRVEPLDGAVLERAALLRQERKMGLGDALIAATALELGCPLVTRNTRDFRWIRGLELLDPLEEAGAIAP